MSLSGSRYELNSVWRSNLHVKDVWRHKESTRDPLAYAQKVRRRLSVRDTFRTVEDGGETGPA